MTSSDTKLPPDFITQMTTIAFLPSRQSHAPILPVFTSSKHLTNSFLGIHMFYSQNGSRFNRKARYRKLQEFRGN